MFPFYNFRGRNLSAGVSYSNDGDNTVDLGMEESWLVLSYLKINKVHTAESLLRS